MMKTLGNNELMSVNGGISNTLKYALVGVAAGVTFIASVVYGFIHPEKC